MAYKEIYEMQFSYEAMDIKKSEQANKRITEFFEEGETVIGEPYKKNHILVDERFVIPLEYVEKTDKFPYLKKDSKFGETIERIKQQSVAISEKEKEELDRVGTNIKDVIEGKTKKKITNRAKAYKNGALLGLGGGIILALYFKKNVWTFGLIGVAVGGYVAHELHKAKSGETTTVTPLKAKDGTI